MSFKYAKARIYSSPAPPFAAKELLPNIPEDMAPWWNLRNDDIYNLRWGDPDYVKQFILNLPRGGKTAGYYMGPAGLRSGNAGQPAEGAHRK